MSMPRDGATQARNPDVGDRADGAHVAERPDVPAADGRPAAPGWRPGRLPVRWRLALFYAGLSALILLLLGVLLYRQVDAFLIDNTAARLRAQAQPILSRHLDAALVRAPAPLPALPDSPDEPVREPVPETVEEAQIRVIFPGPLEAIAGELTTGDTAALVLSPNGAVLAAGKLQRLEQPVSLLPDLDRVRQAATESVETAYVTTGPDGGRVLAVLIPLRRADGALLGVLQLATSMQAADALLARLRLLLMVGLGSALSLSMLLGVPLTRAALRPLDRLVATTERIAADDLAARSRLPHGDDEIGRLAAAFDRMLARLQAGFQAQRRFVADAAHELRTPLTVIGGLIELLLLGADNEDRQTRRRALVTVNRDLERLTRLVNDLLTLSREDLAVPHDRRLLDLAALVADIQHETVMLAQDRTVVLERPPGPVHVEGDPDRLRQVLLNLADNARGHTPPGGRIAFSVRSNGTHAEAEVADTGPGIAPEDLPHIFERFYRGDRARARRSGGSGLGLAIARSIAEAHGGTLTAAGRPGAGATFTLRLPLAAASGVQVPRAVDTASSPAHR